MDIQTLNEIVLSLQEEVKNLKIGLTIMGVGVFIALLIILGFELFYEYKATKEKKQKEHDAKLKKEIINDIVNYYNETKGEKNAD